MKIEIKNGFNGSSIIISGDYDSVKDCLKKNSGSDLSGSNLSFSNLSFSDLSGSKGYVGSHDIFQEAVRRQKVEVFVEAEWNAIAQIVIHRLCWDSIEKRFSDVMPHIFKVLADAGFKEWLEYWNTRSLNGR